MRGSTAGLAEGTIVTRNTLHGAFLTFLDMTFASVIAAPAVVAYWQGTWNLSHLFLLPGEKLWSPILSCIIGVIGHFIAIYFQDWFSDVFHPDKRRLTFMVVSRIYTEIFGIIGINCWRGGWELLDMYCPSRISTLLVCTAIGTILLIACKGLRNISSSPFGVSTDNSKDYFVVPTMFKTSVRNSSFFFFTKQISTKSSFQFFNQSNTDTFNKEFCTLRHQLSVTNCIFLTNFVACIAGKNFEVDLNLLN